MGKEQKLTFIKHVYTLIYIYILSVLLPDEPPSWQSWEILELVWTVKTIFP
jgi:hypothetical protein